MFTTYIHCAQKLRSENILLNATRDSVLVREGELDINEYMAIELYTKVRLGEKTEG